jgi:hypothetical protein
LIHEEIEGKTIKNHNTIAIIDALLEFPTWRNDHIDNNDRKILVEKIVDRIPIDLRPTWYSRDTCIALFLNVIWGKGCIDKWKKTYQHRITYEQKLLDYADKPLHELIEMRSNIDYKRDSCTYVVFVEVIALEVLILKSIRKKINPV